MAKLRGLAWDHRRCWGPLDASVAPYCAAHPGLEIEWDRRSLYEFGEGAIDPVLAAVRSGRFRSSVRRRDCARPT